MKRQFCTLTSTGSSVSVTARTEQHTGTLSEAEWRPRDRTAATAAMERDEAAQEEVFDRSVEEETSATKIQNAVRNAQRSRRLMDSFSGAFKVAVVKPIKVSGTAASSLGSSMVDGTKRAGSLVGGALGVRTKDAVHDDDFDDRCVDARTPADRWFEPHIGWPCTDEEGARPNQWMPTAKTEEALFPDDADGVIGELRVEVMQAEGLPNNDAIAGITLAGNKTDSYALVLFEGTVARTSVVRDSLNPRWGANDPKAFRAFKFPVIKPYSVLYVSINDYDGSIKQETMSKSQSQRADAAGIEKEGSDRLGVNSDDPIGRVAIQLSRLLSGHEYDCWHALSLSPLEKPDASLGCVRLRYSVTFKSERQRILKYATSPPSFFVPLYKASYRTSSQFAKRGLYVPEEYNWDVLMSYVDELRSAVQLLLRLYAALESIIYWRLEMVHYSASNFLLFQFLVSYPTFFPASWGLGLLVLLISTYDIPDDNERLNHAMHTRPRLRDLMGALILDKPPRRFHAGSPSTVHLGAVETSDDASTSNRAVTGGNIDQALRPTRVSQRVNEEQLAGKPLQNVLTLVHSEVMGAAAEYWQEKILGVNPYGLPKNETLLYKREVCSPGTYKCSLSLYRSLVLSCFRVIVSNIVAADDKETS